MTELTLTIGDKNLSSWSLRPWLLMKQAGIAFTEETIFLDRPESRRRLSEKSPSGLVPFLTHGETKIWDSLAIAEYLNELYPEKQLWPEDRDARAFARAIAAEMHSGFSTLRTLWPMMVLRRDLRHLTGGGVDREIERIVSLWAACRARFGKAGPFLFGNFSIADAMYAPVVSRFFTYGPIDADGECLEYMRKIDTLATMQEWRDGAQRQVSAASV